MREWQNKAQHGRCRSYFIILLASVVFGCGGCSLSLKNQEFAQPPDMHNSRNALDWTGTYAGTLPCADCSGIRTTLTLSPAHTYVLKSTYLEVEAADTEYISEGVFEWDDAGTSVELLDLSGGHGLFQVGENRLFALDQSGRRIEGDLAQAYVLERVGDITPEDVTAAVGFFVDKTWELVALRGVYLEKAQVGDVWLVFQRELQRVYGSVGCNRLTGSWAAGDKAVEQRGQRSSSVTIPLPLQLSPLGTTMMTCPSELMQLEDKFLSVLAEVSGVYLDGKELILVDKSGQKVARLKARKLR